mmetsp:Transcript_35351/g.69617  ORF Transcript_35351/g.69617 Transcript_35351/m.69617 type:complete len:760 (+) Transcript_35351:131-2410(+)|eukprot:CAMPEP_0194304468 /NCGR_PEP_ID=MMETSP0171-20130528/2230_1 /TAXON_ID=218684 /ORGANISM="Corethron pennatum, Strain L29A3" /LENGTH=759 /DNA_ID=CAMNT_0039055777 /DNA_START=67 /DNA_END=2346 /DNA_ORIENTATION=-
MSRTPQQIEEMLQDNETIDGAITLLSDMLNSKDLRGNLFGPKKYTETYTASYKLCTFHGEAHKCYSKFEDVIESHLHTHAVPSLRRAGGAGGGGGMLRELRRRSSGGGDGLLNEFRRRWDDHLLMSKWLEAFLRTLNRFYVPENKLPTLKEVAMKVFRVSVYDVMGHDIRSAMVEMIDRERNGEMIDRDLLKACVGIFGYIKNADGVDVYEADFESEFLTSTRVHYRLKSQEWITKGSASEYFILAERAINTEKYRITGCVRSATEGRLMTAMKEEILDDVADDLLVLKDSGCSALLDNGMFEDLALMFRMLSLTDNGIGKMAKIFGSFIIKLGNQHIQKRKDRIESADKEKADDPKFVEAILEFHTMYSQVVCDTFQGDALFQKMLKEAFEDILSQDVGRYTNAEVLSTHCDRLLKTGGEKLNEEGLEKELQKTIVLFSYLKDKDLFGEIYKNQLAKRLLNQKSRSAEAEKSMISKMKMQCGTQFTAKMEGMMMDLAISEDQKKLFASYVDNQQRFPGSYKVGPDLTVQVLTMGFWPSYKPPDLSLTPEMKSCIDVFEEWHSSVHNQRRLVWQHAQGSAQIRATFNGKSYTLLVNTLQATALDMFNTDTRFTFNELKSKLNLDDQTLKHLLHSLSCGKNKIILKDSSSKKISETDVFWANEKFKSKLRKISLPMPSLDATHSMKRIHQDRRHVIDAAVVRIMKARKTLSHHGLISETMIQLRTFSPKAMAIKRQIEALIDRDYLERDENNNTQYNYLA